MLCWAFGKLFNIFWDIAKQWDKTKYFTFVLFNILHEGLEKNEFKSHFCGKTLGAIHKVCTQVMGEEGQPRSMQVRTGAGVVMEHKYVHSLTIFLLFLFFYALKRADFTNT